MPKFITVTGNLLAETTARFKFPQMGETVRAVGSSTFQVGGKGVNVARTALSLGIRSIAVIFPAGFSGKKCLDYLKRENFEVLATEIDGETREGLVCVDSETETQTTFLGSDLPIPQNAFENSLEAISKNVSKGDIVAFCGSFPNWQSSYAEKLADICKKNNAYLCVDTYGKPLKDFAKVQSDFLKFNKKELYDFLKDNGELLEKSFKENFKLARQKYFYNTKIFTITDGVNDILFAEKSNNFVIEKISPMKIEKEISATSCGDAFFAVALSEIFIKQSPLKLSLTRASKYASICASIESVGILPAKETLIALS